MSENGPETGYAWPFVPASSGSQTRKSHQVRLIWLKTYRFDGRRGMWQADAGLRKIESGGIVYDEPAMTNTPETSLRSSVRTPNLRKAAWA